jgi:hypothetical protein
MSRTLVAQTRPARGAAAARPAGRPRPTAVLLALLAVDALLLAPLPPELHLFGALALFVLLPGWVLIRAVFGPGGPVGLERALLALGSGCVLAMVPPLLLHVFFRPIEPAHLLLAGNLLVLVGAYLPLLWTRSAGPGAEPAPEPPGAASSGRFRFERQTLLALALLLLIAAPLRLWNLGWSEFQGDEAKVALRTSALLQGLPNVLQAHRRPPGEILISTTLAGQIGTITELTARLPFSLAGVAAVLACYQLGRTMFGPTAGLIAALLLAVNGYYVAFGRILQYQSLGLLLDMLTVLCLYRFARWPAARPGYALVGGLLLAGALASALSGVFLLPPLALALWASRRGPSKARWRDLALWFWPLAPLLLVGLAVLLKAGGRLSLGAAESYILTRLGWQQRYFNWDDLLVATNLYTSSLYLAVTLVGGVLALLFTPGRARLGWRLALVWMLGPLLTHLFLVRIVATHWREIYPGLVLLLGAGAAAAASSKFQVPGARFQEGETVCPVDQAGSDQQPASRGVPAVPLKPGTWNLKPVLLALPFALFLAATGHYVFSAWVAPWPEYMLQFPRYRHPLDWTSLQERGAGGTFGASRRHGWKAVAELIAAGELPADYSTNEQPAAAAWYLSRLQTCAERARLYIRAPITPRDRDSIEQGGRPKNYRLFGVVEVDGQPGLALYVRGRASSDEHFDLAPYAERFDRARASAWRPVNGMYESSVNNVPGC